MQCDCDNKYFPKIQIFDSKMADGPHVGNIVFGSNLEANGRHFENLYIAIISVKNDPIWIQFCTYKQSGSETKIL